MKNRVLAIIIVFLIVLSMAMPIIAASDISDAIYEGDVSVQNTDATLGFTNAAGVFTNLTANMITSGYSNATASDTAMRLNGTDVAFMPGWSTNPWVTFISSIAVSQTLNYKLYSSGVTGGKIAYFPGTAGITTNDGVITEFGNNFAYEVKGPLTTGMATIFEKPQAVKISKFDNNVLLAGIGVIDTNFQYVGAYWTGISGNQVLYQSFTPSTNIATDTIYMPICFNPSYTEGLALISLYLADANHRPTGGVIASLSTALSTSVNWTKITFSSSFTLTSGTEYVVSLSPQLTGNNLMVNWYYTNGSNGTSQVYTWNGSAYVWSTYTGKNFGLIIGDSNSTTVTGFGDAQVQATTSGDHTYKVYADATNLKIDIGGVNAASTALSGASVPNNANNIVMFANNSMPYVEYSKIWVGGTLEQHLTWQYAATLTDQSGLANDPASVSFRTTATDSDLIGTLSSLAAITQAIVPDASVGEANNPVSTPPATPSSSGWSVPSFDVPIIGDLINDLLTASDTPPQFFWYPIITFILILISLAAYKYSFSLLVKFGTNVTVVIFICALHIYPWLILPLIVIWSLAILLHSQRGQL